MLVPAQVVRRRECSDHVTYHRNVVSLLLRGHRLPHSCGVTDESVTYAPTHPRLATGRPTNPKNYSDSIVLLRGNSIDEKKKKKQF